MLLVRFWFCWLLVCLESIYLNELLIIKNQASMKKQVIQCEEFWVDICRVKNLCCFMLVLWNSVWNSFQLWQIFMCFSIEMHVYCSCETFLCYFALRCTTCILIMRHFYVNTHWDAPADMWGHVKIENMWVRYLQTNGLQPTSRTDEQSARNTK